MSTPFPTRVAVHASPASEGLAVDLCFQMTRKNSFHYMVFLDADGTAEVSGSELLHLFDEDRGAFLMDYVDPRTNFTGQVTAKVLGTAELAGAIQAFEMFRGKVSFPSGYENNLRTAAAQGQSPEDYQVEVTVA